MRKLLFLGLTVIYALISTFCEFTPDVLAHVTNEEKYIEIDVEVVSSKYNDDGYSYIYVKLTDFSYYKSLTGSHADSYTQDTLDNTVVKLKMLPENAEILRENGFFDIIKLGDLIKVRTTAWIHNGVNHNYVAQLTLGEIEYLDFETGFNNMVASSKRLKELDLGDVLKSTE